MSTNHNQEELYRKIRFLQEEYKDLLDNYRERGQKIHELSQIVKRVKEQIKKKGNAGHSIYYPMLQKILDGKK